MRKIARRDFLFYSGIGTASLFSSKRAISYQHPAKTNVGSSIHGYDPWVEIDLDNMGWNLSQIKKTARVPIMAVVKANAYGHGLVEVAQYLEKEGIDYLMVGKLKEAIRLRENGISCPILNFGRFHRDQCEEIIRKDVSQSVFDEDIRCLNQSALRLGKKARIHIHVDTGMGRMGIPYLKGLPYIQAVSSLQGIFIEAISTTLTEDDDFDLIQLNRFLILCQECEKVGIYLGLKHAASSDGILDLAQDHLDMVRPGILLYGYYPSDKTRIEDRLAVKPALQLKARVVDVKTIRKGESLSYHRRYTAQKREKIAVIPVGYSDGYPTNIVDKGHVLIGGKKHPLVAAITANHSIALLDDNSRVASGDEVVLIGKQGKGKITADDIAGWAGVSTYKVLIDMNPFLPRIIK